MIAFDAFQAVSLAIVASLFIYLVIQFILFLMTTFENIDEGDTLRPVRPARR
jgi:hypothetical protein